MKDILKLAFALGVICLVGAGALAAVKQGTQEPIRKAETEALSNTLRKVLPPNVEKTEQSTIIRDVKFYRGLDVNGAVVAFAAEAKSTVNGFGGPTSVVAGLDTTGKILAVMVSAHTETPGLGTKATDRVAPKSFWDLVRGKIKENPFPPNAFLDAYAGKAAPVELDRDVMHVTGATYSSKSVNSAVNAILGNIGEFLAQERAQRN
jgi:electron transport complex protein RnfG